MNLRKILLSILCFCFFIQINSAQNKSKSKDIFLEAEYYLLYEDYKEALPLYLKIYDTENTNANLDYRIGLCYLNIPREKQKAIPFLEKATQRISSNYREGSYRETNAPISSLFYLGNAYRINNQLEDALNSYKKFRELLTPKDLYSIDFVDKQIQNCNNAKELVSNPIMTSKTNLGEKINTRFPNINCIISGNDSTLAFTSKLKFYDAIFYTTKDTNGIWSNPKNITPQLRTEGKCYTTSLSFDGKSMLIFLDDNYGGDIYISNFSDETKKWSFIEKLNKNINSRYWETHASFSLDRKTIYFSSNRKGGYGGLDIYKSEFDEITNDWGEAKNLGPVINSIFNDECAYITKKNILYFSSQGHFNMGGYDIFYSKKIDQDNWSEPLNIGYPINTPDDNLFFQPGQDGIFAYYSDFDSIGYGNEDIMLLEIFSDDHPFNYTIKGTITLQDNKKEFERNNIKISISDSNTEKKIATILPDKNSGEYTYKITSGNYNIKFSGEGYNQTEKRLFIPKKHMGKKITLNAEMEPLEVTTKEFIVIKSILFDFDDYSLKREALIEIERLFLLMQKYPSLYIEVIGHCDSQGTYKYNLNLSKKRSRSVIDYLIEKGIEPDRFVSTGAGENHPIANNKNADGTDNPEGRKYNRRVELKILKSNDDIIVSDDTFVPPSLIFSGGINYTILLNRGNKELNKDYFAKKLNYSNIKSHFTGKEYLYTMGTFENKPDAIESLNNVIDSGFENAEIIDTDEIRDLIRISEISQKNKEYKSNIFTIQILATRKPIDLSFFKYINDIKVKKGKDNFYRYIHGKFNGYDSAKEYLETIIELGYVDAFVMNIEKYQ